MQPSSMGASEVVYRNDSRVNGCSLPLNAFQFVAWGCFLYFAVYYFTCAVPLLLSRWQPVAYVIVAVFFIIHFIVHILACLVNPADPNVLAKMKKGQKTVGQFDRAEHRHVIEDLHCYVCDVDVAPGSKHCRMCNKCVASFDHHCKWLNNCVGSRNHRLFVATLLTGVAGCVSIVVVCLLQFVAYYTDKENGNILKPYYDFYVEHPNTTPGDRVMSTLSSTTTGVIPVAPEFTLFYAVVPDIAWLTVTMFSAVLATVGGGLLGHLLGFHFYLLCKNLTTYDYIVKEREKSEQRAREQTIQETQIDTARSKNKLNKIRPDGAEMQTKRSTRGIDEYAVMETARLSGETPPPAPTPPPPSSGHSYHLNSATLAQRLQHELASGNPPIQRRKKKKKSKRLSSSAEYPTGFSHKVPLSPGNNIGGPPNGRLPTLADSKELMDRIHKSLVENKSDVILSDDTLHPNSIKDVDLAVEKKRKKKKTAMLKKEAMSINTASGTDESGQATSDSGCDLENGNQVNSTPSDKSTNSPVLLPGELTHNKTVSPCDQGASDIDYLSSRDSRNKLSRSNNIEIERLELPHSSNSDYEDCKAKDVLPIYSPRGYKAGKGLYHTMPSVHPSSHHKPHCHTGSTETLHEIPVSNTRYGTRHAIRPHDNHHTYGPEIGDPPRRKYKKKRTSSKHGVINKGATLEDSSSEDEEDGIVITPHGVHYGNKVIHTVEIYSDRTPRPPRHKDVPPLDLSRLHNDGDIESAKRSAIHYQQASKI